MSCMHLSMRIRIKHCRDAVDVTRSLLHLHASILIIYIYVPCRRITFFVCLIVSVYISTPYTQFLNRSIAHSARVVDTLAAFGLGYIIIKVFTGILESVRDAGLVLVHDRSAYRRVLLFSVVLGSLVMLIFIITGKHAYNMTRCVY